MCFQVWCKHAFAAPYSNEFSLLVNKSDGPIMQKVPGNDKVILYRVQGVKAYGFMRFSLR